MAKATGLQSHTDGHRRHWLRSLGSLLVMLGPLWLVMGYLGLAVLPVRTASMVPAIYPADMVVGVHPRLVPPGVGKVVVAEPYFTEGGEQLPPIAHRIIGTQQGGWETQGDANPNPDGWIVRDQDITHVVVATLPTRYARDPRIIAGIVGVAALAMFWPRPSQSSGPMGPAGGAGGASSPQLTPLRPQPPGQARHSRGGKHRTY